MKNLKSFNEHNNMDMEVYGLKCDNTECDWSDMTIPFEDYEKNVNAPCPECGENILTEEDYNQLVQMKQATEMVNKMSPEQIEAMVANLSPEQIDAALDMMNSLGLKKTGENDDGTENWTTKD